MNEVLETTKYVIDKSRQVAMDRETLKGFSNELAASGVQVPPWDCHYHYCGSEEEMIGYLLVLDTINFCFWSMAGEKRWEVLYDSKKVSGYFGVASALKLALESGVPLNDPAFLRDMTTGTLQDVLGGTGTLPLFHERADALNELGRLLISQYSGRAIHLVEEAGGSAVALARLLAHKLTSFQDVATYDGRKVCFYKRAQIFASDLHGAFRGKSWGRFSDMNALTAFADYKLPQVLRHLGILQYDKDLAEKVDRQANIQHGSAEEVEIRAHTIWAVELIRQALAQKGKSTTASQIDWMLWNLGQNNQYRAKPYHRTLTVFY